MNRIMVAAIVGALALTSARAETFAQREALQAAIQAVPGGGTWWMVNAVTARCVRTAITPRGLFRWALEQGLPVTAHDVPNVAIGQGEVVTVGDPPDRHLLVKPFGACQALRDYLQKQGTIPGR